MNQEFELLFLVRLLDQLSPLRQLRLLGQ